MLFRRWLYMGRHPGSNGPGFRSIVQYSLWLLSGCLCGCITSSDAVEREGEGLVEARQFVCGGGVKGVLFGVFSGLGLMKGGREERDGLSDQ